MSDEYPKREARGERKEATAGSSISNPQSEIRNRKSEIQKLGDYRFAHPEEVLKARQRKYVDYFVQACARPTPEQPVLDLGCGRGFFLDLLAEAGLPAFGVDTSSEAIAVCRERGQSNCLVADALDYLEGTDQTFAGIFCSHVVEHLTPPQVQRLMAAMAARLAAGGCVVLITPNPLNLHVVTEAFYLDVGHVRLYPLPLLEAICHEVGLEIVAKGWDRDTVVRPPLWRWPLHVLRALVLGRYYLAGEDIFLVVETAHG